MLANIFDYVRYGLYITLVLLCFFLFQAWDKDHPKTQIPAEKNISERFVPAISSAEEVHQPVEVKSLDTAPKEIPGQVVTVTTDLLQVKIDTRGGDIVKTSLLKYPSELDGIVPIVLFNDDPNSRYIAESGLLSSRGPDTKDK